MQKTDILKNKNIFILILSVFLLGIAYKYFVLNLKAANSYGCNHYSGRCFIDNSFGKSNNLEDCNADCLKKRYKYYFNKLVNNCVLDFRGTYDSKEQCDEANRKDVAYLGGEYGCAVASYDSGEYMPLLLGSDRESCLNNIRPIGRVYECDLAGRKCNLVDKADDNAQLTYDSCWTYCMGQDIHKLPKETMYGCSNAGFCHPNPSGGFKTYEECYNNIACKVTSLIYKEKTNTNYKWDETLKKCVKDGKGEFKSWSECRAIKEGIGSEFVYTCDSVNKKCLEKKWDDFLSLVIVAGKTGCYSSDCMNMGQGTHAKYEMPDMACDINDKCLLNPEAPKAARNTIYLTKNACQKDCEGANAKDPDTGRPIATASNSVCIINHWLDVGQDFCNNNDECGTINNVCRNKKNLPNQIYETVLESVCNNNKLKLIDFDHTCRCVGHICTEVNSHQPTIRSVDLASMICGDGKCWHIERTQWLYWGMNKLSNGEYKLAAPEWNKYYCAQDCK